MWNQKNYVREYVEYMYEIEYYIWTPNTEKISKMIKDKIDFVYELCFTF